MYSLSSRVLSRGVLRAHAPVALSRTQIGVTSASFSYGRQNQQYDQYSQHQQRGGGGGWGKPQGKLPQAGFERKLNRGASEFFAKRQHFLAMGQQKKFDRDLQATFETNANQTGIEFEKYDNLPVSKSGVGADEFEPLSSFADIKDIPPFMVENMARCNYNNPTPIQKHTIPMSLAGRDLMCSAQTGSGKTAAFLIPLITSIARDPEPPIPQGDLRVCPRAVLLAPTRELAVQLHQEALKLCHKSNLRAIAVFGGASVMPQMDQLSQGCDILIGTPGRMNDFVERGVVSMQHCKFLVLDEADRMLDMGFEPQIRGIVDQGDMPNTENRQTVMFSATFPDDIQTLAQDFLTKYLWINIGKVGATNESIEQRLLRVDNPYDKDAKLVEQMNAVEGRTLVFVNMKREADRIANFLSDNGIQASAIHGDLEQTGRQRALDRFRSDRCRVLVATDVAARGLDVPMVSHVINYAIPLSAEDYVHRIGRTGRNGHTGIATSFISPSDGHVFGAAFAKEMKQALGPQGLPEWYVDMCQRLGSHQKAMKKARRGGGRLSVSEINKDKINYNHERNRSSSSGTMWKPNWLKVLGGYGRGTRNQRRWTI